MAYTKLFNSIVTSTIWTEDDRTRIVWITMLACADKNGEIQASIPGLARIAGVPVEDCRIAVSKFLSPDPDSRTKDDEGRRIEEIDGGWSLLNFRKYREMASKEDAKASEAARKARYRARISRNVPKCPDGVHGMSTHNPHIAEADTEAYPLSKKTPNSSEHVPDEIPFDSYQPAVRKYPTEDELDEFLQDEELDDAQTKGNLWDSLENRGWTDHKTGLPIVDWRAYIRKFDEKMKADHPANGVQL